MKWKKLINDSETISYVKELNDYRVIIEARGYDDGWEIVKKYLGSGINFAETYNAQSLAELRRLLKHLRQEKDLSKNEISDIKKFKKRSIKVFVKRGYKDANVEKWHFSIAEDFSNFIVVHYGKEISIDIVMEEQLKYIEENIIARLYEVLGIISVDEAIVQNIYYFSKKTSSFIESEGGVDVEFLFE